MKTSAQQLIETLNKWNAKQVNRQGVVTRNYIQVASKAVVRHAGSLKEVQVLNAVFFLN